MASASGWVPNAAIMGYSSSNAALAEAEIKLGDVRFRQQLADVAKGGKNRFGATADASHKDLALYAREVAVLLAQLRDFVSYRHREIAPNPGDPAAEAARLLDQLVEAREQSLARAKFQQRLISHLENAVVDSQNDANALAHLADFIADSTVSVPKKKELQEFVKSHLQARRAAPNPAVPPAAVAPAPPAAKSAPMGSAPAGTPSPVGV